jgi:kumamolisin
LNTHQPTKAMAPSTRPTPLEESARPLPPGTRAAGPVPARQVIHITVVMRPPSARQPRARALQDIRTFCRVNGLRVVKVHSDRNVVALCGTAARLSRAFGVALTRYTSPLGTFFGHQGPITIPAYLCTSVDGIIGLNEFPVRRVSGGHRHVRKPSKKRASYHPYQMARFYNFPAAGDGRGQSVALIELAGGFRLAAVRAYFRALKLKMPHISIVQVDGEKNRIKIAPFEDAEVQGDIETLGSVAPGARIVVYIAPLTERGLYDAVVKALHDKVHRPSILSISFGEVEMYWPPRTLRMLNDVLELATTRGVTVCCAAGDSGSSGGVPGGRPHVFFPASSPYSLACGGTQITTRGDAIVNERVWRDGRHATTGGGVSRMFPAPPWQASVKMPPSPNRKLGRGRGLPDVAANAADYMLTADGETFVTAGTSAVAPLWAGLLARVNQIHKRPAGFITPALYKAYAALLVKGAIREVTKGSNGAYRARKGWNPCAGLGSPDGAKLTAHLAPHVKRRRRG